MESVFSGIVLLQKKLYQYKKEDERKKEEERLMKAFPQPLQHSHLNGGGFCKMDDIVLQLERYRVKRRYCLVLFIDN